MVLIFFLSHNLGKFLLYKIAAYVSQTLRNVALLEAYNKPKFVKLLHSRSMLQDNNSISSIKLLLTSTLQTHGSKPCRSIATATTEALRQQLPWLLWLE